MELKDVLHFYLGCPVMAVTSKLSEHKRKLVGVYDDGERQSVKLWFTGGTSDWELDDEFKLILRPLRSMTEEEGLEIAKLVSEPQYIESGIVSVRSEACLRKPKEDQHSIQRIEWKAYEIIKHSGDKPKVLILHITSWGTINIYVGRHYGSELGNNAKQIFVTRYLLSKGFDLFGLIEKGLALDSTTLPKE